MTSLSEESPPGVAGTGETVCIEGKVPASVDPRGVLVGMSGRIDSMVAALLLRDQGYRVVGATMAFWRDPMAKCRQAPSLSDTISRARRVADDLGLPHVTLNLADSFYQQVVTYFVHEYESGGTPNPCTKCNARLRFGALLNLAQNLGLSWIATGHYARMLGEPPRLHRGRDLLKDQSYVLAEVDPDLLRHTLFPLGELTKDEVRTLAVANGLEGRQARESQEICFIPDDDYRRFLRERLGERPGRLIDWAGRTLGHHTGTYNFTVGQRKGLGLSSSTPLYVLRVDTETGDVMMGGASELDTDELIIKDLVWHRRLPTGKLDPSGLAVQVRSSGAPAVISHISRAGVADSGAGQTPQERGLLRLRLHPPASAVAPGQTAVIYAGDEVVVAGTIKAAATAARV